VLDLRDLHLSDHDMRQIGFLLRPRGVVQESDDASTKVSSIEASLTNLTGIDLSDNRSYSPKTLGNGSKSTVLSKVIVLL